MVRTWLVGIGMLAVVGCHHQAATTTAMKVAPRVAMDSVEIARLCTQPDSVRAGRADCVLKDQSRAPDRRLFETPPR